MPDLTIDQVICWRAAHLQDPTVEMVVEALSRKGLPRDVPAAAQKALGSWRKMSHSLRVARICKSLKLHDRATAALPASAAVAQPALARIETIEHRGHALELVNEGDRPFITLRCLSKLLDKRPDNLCRVLKAQDYEILDLKLPNERGEERPTPCVHMDQIVAVIACADLREMEDKPREMVLLFRRELPSVFAAYQAKRNTLIRPEPTGLTADLTKVIGEAVAMGIATGIAKVGELLAPLTTRLARLEQRAVEQTPIPAPTLVLERAELQREEFEGNGHTIEGLMRRISAYLQHQNPPTQSDIESRIRTWGLDKGKRFRLDTRKGELYDEVALTFLMKSYHEERYGGLDREAPWANGNAAPAPV
jgi:hypothetical protein